jgi:hypothetical protein
MSGSSELTRPRVPGVMAATRSPSEAPKRSNRRQRGVIPETPLVGNVSCSARVARVGRFGGTLDGIEHQTGDTGLIASL